MAPFTNAANKAIPARTITAVSREGIFGFSQLPASGHVARGIVAQRFPVSEGAHAMAARLLQRTRDRPRLKGRSRNGLTSKIHVVVDANGLPMQLGLTPTRLTKIGSARI